MIFISKNEAGVPAWKLILSGKKTVTRRTKKPLTGKVIAVCPGRGKKAVCKIRVLSVMPHTSFFNMLSEACTSITTSPGCIEKRQDVMRLLSGLEVEAQREGFETWKGLTDWFKRHKIDICDTYRIEFELVK
jgi:hypothetical protein